MVITRRGSERVHDFAFRLARRRKARGGPGRVTCVDKANVFRSMAFFRKIFDERARAFPDIEARHNYIDATALDLIRKPWEFDVIVTENMFGDILSDQTAGLVGGMGMAPSADIGDEHGLFQPCHGSAPDIAGQGKANPDRHDPVGRHDARLAGGAPPRRRAGAGGPQTRARGRRGVRLGQDQAVRIRRPRRHARHRGRNRVQPLMGKLRVAVVGAGYFSRFHLEGWRDVGEAEVVGWCDTDAPRVEAMAREFGIARTFNDLDAMLDALAPDLVDIVTPPPSHAGLVARAHERRIPVICQKPLTPSWAESLALADAVERSNTLCVVHENFRFQPWYREARRLHHGRACSARRIRVAFRLRPGDGQGPRAYLDRQPYFQQMPRLLMVETAIHWIDTFRFLLGEVAAITARLRRMNPVIAGEDAGYLLFEFDGGATGLFDGNRLNDHVARDPRRTMGEMWLEGSAGVLRLDGDARLLWKPHHGSEAEHAYDRGPSTFGGGCCAALQRHVVAHLLHGAPVENTVRDYLANLRVQEAAYRIARDRTAHRAGRLGTGARTKAICHVIHGGE